MKSWLGCGIIAMGLMGVVFGAAIGSGFGALGLGAIIGSVSCILFILIYSRKAMGRMGRRRGQWTGFMVSSGKDKDRRAGRP